MNSAIVSLNWFWIFSALITLLSCSSSPIFARLSISSGLRFRLAITKTSNVVLLFFATLEVYTVFGMVSISAISRSSKPQERLLITLSFITIQIDCIPALAMYSESFFHSSICPLFLTSFNRWKSPQRRFDLYSLSCTNPKRHGVRGKLPQTLSRTQPKSRRVRRGASQTFADYCSHPVCVVLKNFSAASIPSMAADIMPPA